MIQVQVACKLVYLARTYNIVLEMKRPWAGRKMSVYAFFFRSSFAISSGSPDGSGTQKACDRFIIRLFDIVAALEFAGVALGVSASDGAGDGEGSEGNPAFKAGLRAANWFSVGLGLLAFITVTIAFRGTGVIGKAKK